jgi:hypothetical protein
MYPELSDNIINGINPEFKLMIHFIVLPFPDFLSFPEFPENPENP